MNTLTKFISRYFFFGAILLASCSPSKLLQVGSQASKDGVLVAQKGIDTYTLLGQQADIDLSQQNVITILTAPNPATVPLQETATNPMAKEIAPRIKAYKNLIRAYTVFGTLTGSDNSTDTKTAAAALDSSYNSFSKLPDLSSGASSAITAAAGAIMQAIESGVIKKQSQALADLTKIAANLWVEEEPVWDRYLGLVYDTYARQLKQVPDKYYDTTKLSTAITEPYTGNVVLLRLYRLDQRNTVIKQKNDIEKTIKDFGTELNLLSLAHAQLAANNTVAAQNSLIDLEALLQAK